MLERVWRKGELLALLVGMETDTAIVENCMEIRFLKKKKKKSSASKKLGNEAVMDLGRLDQSRDAPRLPTVRVLLGYK